MKSRFSRRNRAAFTLVELLVVIAIILVLVALLLPAFSGMRQRSYKVKCVHNLRSFSTSCFMYAADYKGWLPMGCRGAFCGWGGCGATCYYTDPLGNPNHGADACCDNVDDFNNNTFTILTNSYGLSIGVFYCAGYYAWNGGTVPNDWNATHKWTGDLWTGLHYYARRCSAECNVYWPGYPGALSRDLRMVSDTDVASANSPVLITCGNFFGWQHTPAGGGVALVDGRVIWVKAQDWCGSGVCW